MSQSRVSPHESWAGGDALSAVYDVGLEACRLSCQAVERSVTWWGAQWDELLRWQQDMSGWAVDAVCGVGCLTARWIEAAGGHHGR